MLLACAPAALAAPGERPKRLEVWDLELGARVEQLPDEFIDYACGTNGGAPALPLAGWRDFRRCRPEPGGLREVYFRYDDELEYWAKANNLSPQMEQFSGTKTYGFPVVVSALIDDGGTVRGVRAGQRPAVRSAQPRRGLPAAQFSHRPLRPRRLGLRDARRRRPARPRSTASSSRSAATRTSAAAPRPRSSTRHLRKAGQSPIDPRTGRETTGQFESVVRFELVRGK